MYKNMIKYKEDITVKINGITNYGFKNGNNWFHGSL